MQTSTRLSPSFRRARREPGNEASIKVCSYIKAGLFPNSISAEPASLICTNPESARYTWDTDTYIFIGRIANKEKNYYTLQLFFPAGWESMDDTTVLGKLDCIVIAWRETAELVYHFSATYLIKSS